jgi:hypothetical protein
MTTSCSDRDSFSSSYSMLTSHVPSFDGDGQQFTAHVVLPLSHKETRVQNERTRERNVGFVFP